jgi:type VII secretion effector (TIGR04197 family)
MIEIKSNAETAQELAASLKRSGDALTAVTPATKDEQTKLSGNDAAHQAIDTAKTKAEEIAAIESIGTNLQSVSTGFTVVDEATAASIQ